MCANEARADRKSAGRDEGTLQVISNHVVVRSLSPSNDMAKVEFDPGIESVRGILMGTDPFYIRRYPKTGGGVMHIVQARPDRSGHTPSAAEQQTRIIFAEVYGKQRHLDFLERKFKDQLTINFSNGKD